VGWSARASSRCSARRERALGYTLVKLGVRYPSSGGPVAYLIQAFGNGRTVGIIGWLGYFATIVVVTAMVALSFGDYAANAIGQDGSQAWIKIFAAAIVVVTALLNASGARLVDKSQSVIVIGLIAVFLIFIVATLPNLHPDLLDPSGYPSVRQIVSSVAITFFSFLGFAVITFTAGQLRTPARELPLAMYLALGITALLYVAISLSVFGTLTVPEVVHYGPTAIAEAARPTLGDAGYAAMSIAALLATSSSVLATLYAAPGFTGALAKVGQFPPVFGSSSRLGRHGGLVITVVLSIVLLAFFTLGVVVSIGSAISLGIFLLVAVAALELRDEIHAHVSLILAAIAACGIALAVFVVDTLWGDARAFWTTIGMIVAAVVLDAAWKRKSSARLRKTAPQPS
jgi:amino acid transporter